ncbi:MAG: DEAD/DEAH box helicase [Chlamydiota bacterium]
MTNFESFGLSADLINALERMKVVTPTPVQRETIPIALTGSDVLVSAQTGTGKTIAYLIPLIMKLSSAPQETALILAPTRELAMQIQQALNQIFGKSSVLKTVLLIGGAPIFRQLSDLKRRPQLIIGTPGRVTDHLMRGSLSLNSTRFLVIDEADRMMDMGFGIQLDKIAEYLPQERQTLMFSATLLPPIEKLSKKYLNNPKRVCIDTTLKPAPKIKQETLYISDGEKWPQLLQQLQDREGSVIVFVRTKIRAVNLCNDLKEEGLSVDTMHGDLPQRRRERAIQFFRINKTRVMVATDVAARGLDIPHVMHVINYDLPECPEDYIHRIGRTGRAEAEGFALSFVSPKETGKWRAITRMLNPGAPKEEHKGFSQENGPSRKQGFGRAKPQWQQKRFGQERRGGSERRNSQDSFGSEKSFGGPEKRFGQEKKFGQDSRPFKKSSEGNSFKKSPQNPKPFAFKSKKSSFKKSNAAKY